MSSSSTNKRSIVVIGGGIQGVSVAYHLATSPFLPKDSCIKILEATSIAHAASGKGGGFMAKRWGDGSATEKLHRISFELYEELAPKLGCKSFRKLPVLSVAPGNKPGDGKNKYVPQWLNGNFNRVSTLGLGDDTAQITPSEFTTKLLQEVKDKVSITLGTCVGIQCEDVSDEEKKVTGVLYKDENNIENVLSCDSAIISAGPWSCEAEDWFPKGTLSLPMEGIKSTSITWEPQNKVDGTALFCGEDDRFGTHLEVYPRPDNTIYICGIGGSQYISKDDLKQGAFRRKSTCQADEKRVQAATNSFQEMSSQYREFGVVQKTQACMRPCPPDALPYMGSIPCFHGAYINAGHNCWGIAWAPACGKAISELVLTGDCTLLDLSPFNPTRYTPKKQDRGRKRQGTNIGEQW